ncbi:lipoate--protein ligase family protein [Tumebacillus permanentifrigoris]|jgi:lipoyl(octanoyl) transferase|uniref:Lipoate-protein ligase A n=1 Tax=Tumebacillus permanentifrigoris TaxID=378543 RepID=A0A316DAZ6_9BACL|nr:biotin/lipoate A/B protein ligase family protein [Tumebacillus permanentifrigoris]PWK14272.1 lipoate-protein ligase A [Tumebacillus permanentifrigoris]
METWRLLHTGYSDPAVNMAVDEAILHANSRGLVPPTVRFYGWNPPTLSIGYFQRATKEVDFDALRAQGLGFVRRPTGGRAVLHDKELTYSVIVPESHPMMPTSINESYRILSMGLLEGFRELGFSAEMVSLADEEEKKKFETLGSAACFDSPSWYELVVEGRKVAGSAQVRQQHTILQHGSILLDIDVEQLFSVLSYSSERTRERMVRMFRDKAVSMKDLGRDVTYEEAVDGFTKGFEKGLGISLVPAGLTPEEQAHVEQLVAEKYGTESWNFKK